MHPHAWYASTLNVQQFEELKDPHSHLRYQALAERRAAQRARRARLAWALVPPIARRSARRNGLTQIAA